MNPDQEVLVDRNSEDCEQTKGESIFVESILEVTKFILSISEIWDKVNQQIKDKSHGRLFAVVHVAHHQHKVTEGDLLMVLRDLGASVGQRIRIDKNLLVGSKDFTLIGRPLLPRDLVNVEATVVEKDLSHKKVIYRTYTKRKIKKANCESKLDLLNQHKLSTFLAFCFSQTRVHDNA